MVQQMSLFTDLPIEENNKIEDGSEEDNFLLQDAFSTLTLEEIRQNALDYKEQWLFEVRNIIATEILENSKKGINSFETKALFPVVTRPEEPNYNCKLFDKEINDIIEDFEKGKGIKIKVRKHLQDHVKFLVRY